MAKLFILSSTLVSVIAGCGPVDLQHADTMRAMPREPLGESRLSLKWKWQSADRRTEIEPQEFASPIVVADTLFVGSTAGEFVALRAATGAVRWRKKLGPVGAPAVADRGLLYIGTSDGIVICLEANTGVERWRYVGRGVIDQAPVIAGTMVVFTSEADQVVALDALTGTFKWQYKTETPEEFVLRGHAGIRLDGTLLYTGFSNGTLVALRRENGSVAWSTSLRADAERYYDVDATPVVVDDTLYATSASGGVYAIEKTSGVIRWRTAMWDASEPTASGNVAGITSDGESLFVAVAELGTYRMDLAGNVIWRVGARGGGEPAQPLLASSDPSLLVFTLAKDGVFIANKRSGEILEYFDPGDGVSSAPAVTSDGRLFAMSNRGVLYAFDLE
jgi:outer membrane protein assembly factor BamB